MINLVNKKLHYLQLSNDINDFLQSILFEIYEQTYKYMHHNRANYKQAQTYCQLIKHSPGVIETVTYHSRCHVVDFVLSGWALYTNTNLISQAWESIRELRQ